MILQRGVIDSENGDVRLFEPLPVITDSRKLAISAWGVVLGIEDEDHLPSLQPLKGVGLPIIGVEGKIGGRNSNHTAEG